MCDLLFTQLLSVISLVRCCDCKETVIFLCCHCSYLINALWITILLLFLNFGGHSLLYNPFVGAVKLALGMAPL